MFCRSHSSISWLSSTSMFFPWHLISLTVLLFTLPSLVTSIPTPAHTLRTSSSGVNTTSPISPLDPDLGINPSLHPDWAGDLQFSDCTKARYYFNGRVAFYNPKKTITFWSRKWTVRPEGDEFELPFGTRYSKSREPITLSVYCSSPLVSQRFPKHA